MLRIILIYRMSGFNKELPILYFTKDNSGVLARVCYINSTLHDLHFALSVVSQMAVIFSIMTSSYRFFARQEFNLTNKRIETFTHYTAKFTDRHNIWPYIATSSTLGLPRMSVCVCSRYTMCPP